MEWEDDHEVGKNLDVECQIFIMATALTKKTHKEFELRFKTNTFRTQVIFNLCDIKLFNFDKCSVCQSVL
jgi:hypothetical protein